MEYSFDLRRISYIFQDEEEEIKLEINVLRKVSWLTSSVHCFIVYNNYLKGENYKQCFVFIRNYCVLSPVKLPFH